MRTGRSGRDDLGIAGEAEITVLRTSGSGRKDI
jgi:hypothetical protein